MTNNIKEKDFLNAILRNDFKSFVQKVFTEVSPNSTYLDNWHIDVICSEVIKTMNNEQNRLIINIPPRYMKSIICTVALPAFILGHNPKASIIAVSYSDDLSTDLANKCKRIIESSWYQEIFPATKLSKKSTTDFETTKGGGRYSTSVNGTLTGRGADYIIIDDPIKPQDAISDTMREKTNDWYGNTLYSRLNDKKNGKIIVIMQRLHEEDLTGYLLDTDSSFKLIKIQAIAEQDEEWSIKNIFSNGEKIITRKKGEPLHPEREGLEKLLQAKDYMGSYNFAGQYQQNPAPREGGIIKEAWIKYYNREELFKAVKNDTLRIKSVIQSWDTANKIEKCNDYSVCLTILRDFSGTNYVINVYRKKLEFPNLIKIAAQIHNDAKNQFEQGIKILVEDQASGISLIQSLRTDYHIYGVKEIKPEHDKKSRLLAVSHLIENGKCLFPDDEPTWWLDFKQELLRFPNVKHDDQCDSLSQALNYQDKTSIFDSIT